MKHARLGSISLSTLLHPIQNHSIETKGYLLGACFNLRFPSFVVHAALLGLARSLHSRIHLFRRSLADHRRAPLHCAQRQAVTWKPHPTQTHHSKLHQNQIFRVLWRKQGRKERPHLKWGGWKRYLVRREGVRGFWRNWEKQNWRWKEKKKRMWGKVSSFGTEELAMSMKLMLPFFSLCVSEGTLFFSLYPLGRWDDDCYLLLKALIL